MSMNLLESYDLIRFADLFQEKLSGAMSELSLKRALKQEKEWMSAAAELLRAARETSLGLLERARSLPELAEVRGEYAAEFQGQWVDALERLVAGITFHVGPRDPVLEALLPHQKIAALRKAAQDVAQDYAKELNRRLKSSYVSRMLGEPNFAFAAPVFEVLKAAQQKWSSAYEPEELPEAAVAELRKELIAAAKRIDLAVRQARLLAEAALAPVSGMFEEQGLAAKPKRRSVKADKPEKADDDKPAPEEKARADEEPKAAKAEELAEGGAKDAKPAKKKRAAAGAAGEEAAS